MALIKFALGVFLCIALTYAESTYNDQEGDQNQLIGQLLERMKVLEGNAAIQQQMIMDIQDEMEIRDVKYNKMVEGLQSEVLGLKKELKAMKQNTETKDRRMWRLLHANTKKVSKNDAVKDDEMKNSSSATQMHRREDPVIPQTRQIIPESTVAFSAGITTIVSNIGANQNIVFETVETNIGNAYNPHHGIFIAPVSGTYVFFTTLYATKVYGHFYIPGNFVINGAGKYAIHAESSSNIASGTSSQMLIKHLNQGDDVAIQTVSAVVQIYGYVSNPLSTFSGFLLYPDNSDTGIVG